MSKYTKWNYELVKEYIESLRYILLSKEYKNNSTKLLFKDVNNYVYYYTLNNLCNGWKPRAFDKNNPYTIQNIKTWIKNNKKPFILLSDTYKGTKKNLQLQCLKEGCEEYFQMPWSDLNHGCGCPYCSGHQAGLSNCLATKNPNLASEWHPTLNGDLTPFNVTCGYSKDIWWQCSNNPKHVWKAKVHKRNGRGDGCPYCCGKLPNEDYNLLVVNPELCKDWDYNKNNKRPEDYCPNSNDYVWWKCNKCGHEWKVTPNNRHGSKRGCPKCAESKGEKELDRILTKYNIPHGLQYTFDNLFGIGGGLLRFDVPVFWDEEKTQLRTLIEYDGIFHYEKIYVGDGFETLQIHDQLKNDYCKKHNIKLLRIPYWEFNNIEQILKKEVII
jgi:hypothetical protein